MNDVKQFFGQTDGITRVEFRMIFQSDCFWLQTFRNSCGFIKHPDPGGEPVKITSPGYRVQNFEHQATISSVLNTICFVLEFCFTSPFTIHFMFSSCGFLSSSFVTMQGPSIGI